MTVDVRLRGDGGREQPAAHLANESLLPLLADWIVDARPRFPGIPRSCVHSGAGMSAFAASHLRLEGWHRTVIRPGINVEAGGKPQALELTSGGVRANAAHVAGRHRSAGLSVQQRSRLANFAKSAQPQHP